MAAYSILVKPSAVKEIESIPKKDRQRIISRIRALANQPRPSGSEKLSGQDQYRIRQGRYRVIYSISDSDLTVVIFKVGQRKEIYR